MVWRSGLEVGVGEAVVQQLLLGHEGVFLGPLHALLEVAEDLSDVVGVGEDRLLAHFFHHRLSFSGDLGLDFNLHLNLGLNLGFDLRLRLALSLCFFRLALFSPLVPCAAHGAATSLPEHFPEGMRSSRAIIPQESLNEVDSMLDHPIKSRRNIDLLSVDLNGGVVLVVDHCEDLEWGLLQGLDLEEWMLVLNGSLAARAEVEVSADCAFVADANDAPLPAAVAVDVPVDHGLSFLRFP